MTILSILQKSMGKSRQGLGARSLLCSAFLCAMLPAQAPRATPSPDQLLLKDYRPRSIFRVPQTHIEKARFPIIDMHSHPYAETESQVETWVRTMDAVGVQKTVVMFGTTGKAFDEASQKFRKHPARFEWWCGIDFTGFDQPGFGPAAIAELERCHRAGATGVGEITDKGGGLKKNTGGMHLDDPRMDAILEKCADLGMPINVHVGEDKWMYEPMDQTNDGLMNAFEWKISGQPSILRHDQIIATLDRAVRKHPRTTFIACHFANCCYDLSILGSMLDRYPNLFADIGARYGETAPIPRYVARFYERYQGRLLYGTDMGMDADMYRLTFRILESEDEHFYEVDLLGYHWPMYGFGLKDSVLKKVYNENARNVMKHAKQP